MKRWFSGLSLVMVCVLAFGTPAIATNRITVESKCVAPGATGVTVGVFIENDETVLGLTLALEIRSISGDAYITDTLDLDTSPGGRVGASGLNDFLIRAFHADPIPDSFVCIIGSFRDGSGGITEVLDTFPAVYVGPGQTLPVGTLTNPDAILWSGLSFASPPLAPGNDGSTPSLLFTFDVNSSVGEFEIAMCCIAPAFFTALLTPTSQDTAGGTPFIFTKGVITVTSNAVPEWDSIGVIVNRWDESLKPDETATLSVSATDSDGDSLTLTIAGEIPEKNSEFVQTSGNTWVYTFTPDSGQALTNGTMLLIVADGCGADTTELEWAVDAWSAVRSAGGPIPESYALDQNYPNPFNAGTVIPFSVGEYGHVRIAVYNVLGNRVATLVDEELAPGRYTADWDGRSSDGRSVATGIYFYRISSAAHVATRKMLLLK